MALLSVNMAETMACLGRIPWEASAWRTSAALVRCLATQKRLGESNPLMQPMNSLDGDQKAEASLELKLAGRCARWFHLRCSTRRLQGDLAWRHAVAASCPWVPTLNYSSMAAAPAVARAVRAAHSGLATQRESDSQEEEAPADIDPARHSDQLRVKGNSGQSEERDLISSNEDRRREYPENPQPHVLPSWARKQNVGEWKMIVKDKLLQKALEDIDAGRVANVASRDGPLQRSQGMATTGQEQAAAQCGAAVSSTTETVDKQGGAQVVAPQQQAAVRPSVGYGSLAIRNQVKEKPAEIPEVFGRVHSVESFSAVDGPGIRSVLFLQGCYRRCLFCSNPDTWHPVDTKSSRLSSKQLAKRVVRDLAYYKDGGGITCSGGEPLLQPDFVAALFREAHAMGATTVLDTAGGFGRVEQSGVVLPHTDMVLLCAKAMDPDVYQKLVGCPQAFMLKFVEAVAEHRVPLWLRFVIIPGYTDTTDEVDALIEFAKKQPSLRGVEVLPYHTLGVNKWEELNMDYPLKDMKSPPRKQVNEIIKKVNAAGIRTLL